jgi:minor extracellular protease Epr
MDEVSNHMMVEPIGVMTDPIRHIPESFGFIPIEGDGSGVKICLIDSGFSDHDALSHVKDSVNFTDMKDHHDYVGHSTAIAGLIGASKPEITGIATGVELFFAKAVDNSGVSQFDAVIASILWSIVKRMDIICLPIRIDTYNAALKSVITKAVSSNISIVMSTSDYQYGDTLSVKTSDTIGVSFFTNPLQVKVPGVALPTTYLNQSYAKITGGATSTGIVTGILALILAKHKKEKTKYNPMMLYKQLIQATLSKDIL